MSLSGEGNSAVRVVYPAAFICLLVSGMAGLIYQVVWMRYLALFMGHSSYAVVAVLVAFMGGLALGNAWIGRIADKIRRPMALYGWLEVLIGIYAILFPFYYEIGHAAYFKVAGSFSPASVMLLPIKFVFSLVMILIPTVLMGGTLPVLIKLVTRSLGELRERVSGLYFVNSVGAVLGVIAAEFLLVPSSGLEFTVYVGAGMNLLVGAAAFGISGYIREEFNSVSNDIPEEAAETEIHEPDFSAVDFRLALIGIGLSGFIAMLYEIAWTRMLGMAMGSSSHAFAIMLITFISGIAVGAWIIGRWEQLKDLMRAFAWAEIAVGVTVFLSMFCYAYLPYWFGRLNLLLAIDPAAYPLFQMVRAFLCFIVMFIPTVCLGMTLPLVSRIGTAELARTGGSVGMVFSINTIGTVLGAALTGLWLMPMLGLARVFGLGVAVNVAIGLVILMRHSAQFKRINWIGIPLMMICVVAWSGSHFGETWQRVLSQNVWRYTSAVSSLDAYWWHANRPSFLYHRDGAGASVTVNSYDPDENQSLGLRVNGKTDASTGVDMVTQLLLGHLPMVLRPDSTNALVVGLGSGITCGAVLVHEQVQRLDAVEIIPEVAEAAEYFKEFNDEVLENPKLNVVIDDAKSFLQLTDQEYDVIISEPSNPWVAGVAGVFSVEFYESCASRLKPDGLIVQWVQLYETSDEALETVLATFASVFPHVSLWIGSDADLIILGSKGPFEPNLETVEQAFNRPAVREDFNRIPMTRFPVFLASEIVSWSNGYFITRDDVVVHSDFYPVLEPLAQRGFFAKATGDFWRKYNESKSARPLTLLGKYLQQNELTRDDLRALSSFQLERKVHDATWVRSIIARWHQDYPGDPLALSFSAQTANQRERWEAETQFMTANREIIFDDAESDPDLLRQYAKYLTQSYRLRRSVFFLPPSGELEEVLNKLIELDPQYQRVYRMHLAELAWDQGDDGKFFELAAAAFDPDAEKYGPTNFGYDDRAPYRTLALMMETYWRRGDLANAWETAKNAVQSKFLGPEASVKDPILEMIYRKIYHAVEGLSQRPEIVNGGASR